MSLSSEPAYPALQQPNSISMFILLANWPLSKRINLWVEYGTQTGYSTPFTPNRLGYLGVHRYAHAEATRP